MHVYVHCNAASSLRTIVLLNDFTCLISRNQLDININQRSFIYVCTVYIDI